LLRAHLDAIRIDAGIDYRERALERIAVYLTPLGAASEGRMAAAFQDIAEAEDDDPVLLIEARHIHAKRRAGGVVWFDFSVLCGGPRSQNDYLELALRFHTVLLSNVPRMSAGQAGEARRFTWLVDVLYDHGVKLILSADAMPGGLYTTGSLALEFQRTVSRLVEMQSRTYLEAPRRAVAARV
jgi:cell division protein ZapE